MALKSIDAFHCSCGVVVLLLFVSFDDDAAFVHIVRRSRPVENSRPVRDDDDDDDDDDDRCHGRVVAVAANGPRVVHQIRRRGRRRRTAGG